jgi:hypothetical protein
LRVVLLGRFQHFFAKTEAVPDMPGTGEGSTC